MKFVLIFIMSVLVIVTHQYFPDHQPREIPWLSPHHPIIDKYQHPIIIYYPKSRITPEIYSSQDIHWGNPQDYEENPPSSHFLNYADVQSRGNKIIQTDKLNPRFFFGTSSTITNPFLKTATFTVSATLTLSSVVKCIIAADFLNAAAQVKPCRRKREQFLQGQETFEDEQFDDVISPTQPQLMMSTTLPSFDVSQENRQLPTDPQQKIIIPEIISSKENVLFAQSIDAVANTSGDNTKMKRFLFFNNNNAYVASTTVTSYSFTSKTSTVTVDVAIDKGLNCLPTGFVVC